MLKKIKNLKKCSLRLNCLVIIFLTTVIEIYKNFYIKTLKMKLQVLGILIKSSYIFLFRYVVLF